MARQAIKQYVFVPGNSGVGYVQIPGNYSSAQVIAILDANLQTFIYNFADATLLGTVTWTPGPNANFPTSIDGVTQITLNTNTSTGGYASTDKLAIYVEAPYQAERPFARDAVERFRVANPQSLIDADFEYGLQNTKWQSLFTNNDNPSIYEVPGSDVYANVVSYVTFLGNSLTSGAVAAGSSNVQIISNGFSQVGPGNNQPNWTQNDFALIYNSDTVGKPATTTYVTANVASQNQRALTVVSSTGFVVGDTVAVIYANALGVSLTTTTTSSLTAGATALAVTAGTGIVNGALIGVNTGNITYPVELMAVTAGGGTTSLTVVRNRWNTNSANVAIAAGAGLFVVGQVEVGNVTSVDSGTQISVNRGWLNTQPQDNLYANTIVSKLYWDAGGTTGTNVEIVQMTTIGSAQGNTAQFTRGAMGTTPAPQYGIGSLVLRLAGIFLAGNTAVPLVAMNLKGHAFYKNAAISTQNHYTPVTEGQYQVSDVYTNYLDYVPKTNPALPIGTQVNRWDTYIRYAGFYGTASLPALTFTTDGGNPSTITATSAYAHGLSPGTPIIANVAATAGTVYAFGPATIQTIPSVTSFTFVARGVVTGTVTGAVYVRPNSFFTHRAADGGVNLGTGTPHHGASAARQTKKYFRYQSGKGLMWTSGTLLGSNFDVVSVSASGTGIGNVITITTDAEHQLQVGANVQLTGLNTTGYNGYYIVQQISTFNTFTANVTTPLGSTSPVYGNQPKLVTIGWVGASVRAGIFDDQNGVFWENTGSVLNVVIRSAAFYMAGTVSVEVATNLCTSDGNGQFLSQFAAGDKIVLRGMTHTVTSVIDNNTLTISPVWRGLTNQVRVKPAKVIETRVPQSQWNIDKLDGTGPSGYKLDATKMQMLMIQYTWYGAGFVDFGVRGQNGNYIFCHRFMNNNLNYQAYMRSGNLPARYQAINETPYVILNSNSTAYINTGINSSDTTFTIVDSTQFPTPTPTQPVYVLIENEVLKCTGITLGAYQYSSNYGNIIPATITGVTRAATFNLYQDGKNTSFSAGNAQPHSANVSVRVLNCTSGPSLNHWGSAVILDGGFDTDRGYAYTYQAANVVFPNGLTTTGTAAQIAANATVTAFAMRLAPSVSNQIPGDLGTRDLVNRAQLILQNMIINFAGAGGVQTGQRYLVEGILNPNNISTTSTTWSYLYNSPYSSTVNPSSTIQPSYTQVAPGNLNAVAGSSLIQYTGTQTTYAWGGERLFAIPVNYTNSGMLDLSMVKQLGNSGIPGFNTYPDGPELLAINITALSANASPVYGEIQVQWNESQA